MHTRRVGAFLIGAWLLGSFLMAFVMSQSLVNVDRIMNSPPQAVSKEFEDIGSEVTRRILRFEAAQLNRHLTETWEVMQFGLGAALLVTSILTSHRSRFLIIGTVLMTAIVVYMYFSLTPRMNQLERSFDFLPAGAAARERDNFQSYAVWYKVLEILKSAFGVIIAARLLFDRYDWRASLIGTAPAAEGKGKGMRKRRRISGASYVYTSKPGTNAAAPSDTASDTTAGKVDTVDDADDGRVDR
jgi:hypothetical protein